MQKITKGFSECTDWKTGADKAFKKLFEDKQNIKVDLGVFYWC